MAMVAGAGAALEQVDAAARQPALEDVIQARDSDGCLIQDSCLKVHDVPPGSGTKVYAGASVSGSIWSGIAQLPRQPQAELDDTSFTADPLCPCADS